MIPTTYPFSTLHILGSFSVEVISEKDVFIRQSQYLLKRGAGQAALENINKALDTEPDCCLLLTTRSLCYLTLELWQVTNENICGMLPKFFISNFPNSPECREL